MIQTNDQGLSGLAAKFLTLYRSLKIEQLSLDSVLLQGWEQTVMDRIIFIHWAAMLETETVYKVSSAELDPSTTKARKGADDPRSLAHMAQTSGAQHNRTIAKRRQKLPGPSS